MKEKIIYTDNYHKNCVLIVTNLGALKKIETPFVVITIEVISNIPLKTKFQVHKVFMTETDRIVYLILGKLYYHSYFMIIY